MISDTRIFQRLDEMHKNGQPLIIEPVELLEYWDILSEVVKIHYLKELSKTEHGLVFRGEKIKVL